MALDNNQSSLYNIQMLIYDTMFRNNGTDPSKWQNIGDHFTNQFALFQVFYNSFRWSFKVDAFSFAFLCTCMHSRLVSWIPSDLAARGQRKHSPDPGQWVCVCV
jgi:hypothetical protein